MKISVRGVAGTLAAAALAAGVFAAGPAAAQYYPYPPAYYPAPAPYYTPAPRRSGGVAERCATQFGTCQIGPMRPGRHCNCFFPGSGKIPGVSVR